ncbi:MAG: hypothetical protein JW731_02610 [Bacteroidales bacterium]|nr:hypothetical protein [Bacteroidales bacterium]
MNRFLKISSFLLLSMVLWAPSCEDEEESARKEMALLKETREDIRQEFESEYLNEASLFAYEANAKQKLSDCFDYFTIVSDTLQSIAFRKKAGEMIVSNFISTPVYLDFIDTETIQDSAVEMRKMIKSILDNEISLSRFSADSIYVLESLQRVKTSKYAGKLGFNLIFLNTTETDNKDRAVEFYLEKEKKTFGKDTLNIWNIRLGNLL